MDLFDGKSIKPMLIGKGMAPFDDSNYIYKLKWDKGRCVAYLEPGKPPRLRNRRDVRILSKVPELAEISKQAKKRCVLDGELFILRDGCLDFSLIWRHSLMSDRFKTELDSKHNPATFSALDILYYDCQETVLLPLMKCKALLDKSITDGLRMAISRYVDGQGASLSDFAIERELEGIVAKVKDDIYIQEKGATDWIKMKVIMGDDYVVCGYILRSDHMTSIVLRQYRGNALVYKGHITMDVSRQAFDIIPRHSILPTAPSITYPADHGNDRAVWLSPNLVCIVRFIHRTKSGEMKQPVFKRLRFDKLTKECIENV